MKDKIKNKTAAQTFFNQYEEDNNDNKEITNNNNNNDIYDGVKNDTKNNNDDGDIENNNKNNNDDEYLRRLAQGKKITASEIKKNKKVFTSFYMDPDLAVEVDKIASRGVKGDKSKLINKAIRRLLEDYGVID